MVSERAFEPQPCLDHHTTRGGVARQVRRMDTIQFQGIEPECDQRPRRFGGISAIPVRPADPVTQSARRCASVRRRVTAPTTPSASEVMARVSLSFVPRHPRDYRSSPPRFHRHRGAEVQGGISDLARSGELPDNTRVLEAERPEDQSPGSKRMVGASCWFPTWRYLSRSRAPRDPASSSVRGSCFPSK